MKRMIAIAACVASLSVAASAQDKWITVVDGKTLEPAETIPRVAKYIRHFHLEDIAATRVHHHMVPGEGAIDFAPVLQAIRAMNYDDWVTIELYPYIDDPDQAARMALQRVRSLL